MTDANTNVFRKPSQTDKEFFDIDIGPTGKISEKEKFTRMCGKKLQEAKKKGLPFCQRAAQDDYNDYLEAKQKAIKRYGYLPDDFQEFKMDWSKYSDLKNFTLESEDEVLDDNETKRNPGLTVMAWRKKYIYKNTNYSCTVMEDGPSSIARAKNKSK